MVVIMRYVVLTVKEHPFIEKVKVIRLALADDCTDHRLMIEQAFVAYGVKLKHFAGISDQSSAIYETLLPKQS